MISVVMAMLPGLSAVSTPERFAASCKSCMLCTLFIRDHCEVPVLLCNLSVCYVCVYRE